MDIFYLEHFGAGQELALATTPAFRRQLSSGSFNVCLSVCVKHTPQKCLKRPYFEGLFLESAPLELPRKGYLDTTCARLLGSTQHKPHANPWHCREVAVNQSCSNVSKLAPETKETNKNAKTLVREKRGYLSPSIYKGEPRFRCGSQ